MHVGDEENGAALLEPLRRAATPVADLVGMMPYAAIASVHQDPADPLPAWDGSLLLREFTPAAIDALLAVAGPQVDIPIIIAEIRPSVAPWPAAPREAMRWVAVTPGSISGSSAPTLLC